MRRLKDLLAALSRNSIGGYFADAADYAEAGKQIGNSTRDIPRRCAEYNFSAGNTAIAEKIASEECEP
jgi:hypothetical protein